MKILITGFDPFGGEELNPSFEAVKLLPNSIDVHKVIKLELPTVFNKSAQVLEEAIIKHEPDAVICVGQAGGRFDLSIERVAINIDIARIPDNDGNQPLNTPIQTEGENAYFSSLPINLMVKNCKNNNVPASISNTAGTYVCNHIMYNLLHLISSKYPNVRGGFIHVPFVREQVINKPNRPYMEVSTIADGLKICIETIIDNPCDDLTDGFGETH